MVRTGWRDVVRTRRQKLDLRTAKFAGLSEARQRPGGLDAKSVGIAGRSGKLGQAFRGRVSIRCCQELRFTEPETERGFPRRGIQKWLEKHDGFCGVTRLFKECGRRVHILICVANDEDQPL